MSGIFVSYRRVDSRVFAGRLFDRLEHHFGQDVVFMDIEGGIGRGEDFAKAIETAMQSVAAIVVVIGRQWLTCVDAQGRRRLDQPDDWVRGEIATALRRGILVVPVLVDGASVPTVEQLPEDLRPLAGRQFSEITDHRWDYDVGEIVKALQRVVAPKPQLEPPGPTPGASALPDRKILRYLAWTVGTVAASLVAFLAWSVFFEAKPEDYRFSVDPPQVRIGSDRKSPQSVVVTLTNTGKRAAPFVFTPSFPGINPPAGVLAMRDDSCGAHPIDPGASCTATVVFDPKWLNGDEGKQGFEGELMVTAFGNGRGVPLRIEPPAAVAAPERSTLDVYDPSRSVEITLSNKKKVILKLGDITATRADVLVRFADGVGKARDPEVDGDIRRYDPSFEEAFRQALASSLSAGRLQPGQGVMVSPLKGEIAGQTLCTALAPAANDPDPDLLERFSAAYKGCFGLAITGPALSVSFPATGRVKDAAAVVIDALIEGIQSGNRLRRVYVVVPGSEPDTFRSYADALLGRLHLKPTPNP